MSAESQNEMIRVEEEFKQIVADDGGRRYEELSMRGGELKDALGRLAQEARVRKITLKSRTGQTLAEIPLVLGAAGMIIIGPWTAALLAAAWLTRVSILIEYEDAPARVEEDARSAVDQIEVRIA